MANFGRYVSMKLRDQILESGYFIEINYCKILGERRVTGWIHGKDFCQWINDIKTAKNLYNKALDIIAFRELPGGY